MQTPERIWNDERRSAEGRGEGRGKGRRLVRFVQKTQTAVLAETTLVVPRAPPSPALPEFIAPSLSRPSFSLSTSLRRLPAVRSRLRGPAVKSDVLKGTLKRMPSDANCAVREQLALSAARRRPRDDFSNTVRRFVEIVVRDFFRSMWILYFVDIKYKRIYEKSQ